MQPLRRLRALGVGIAFDDFGTGFASLSLLKDYPVSRLKIDRSFVSGVDRSEKDGAIIEAVVKLADGFSLEVIAEGIETEEQEMLMRHYNCDEGQGYLYGRPMTVDAFEQRYLANGAAVTPLSLWPAWAIYRDCRNNALTLCMSFQDMAPISCQVATSLKQSNTLSGANCSLTLIFLPSIATRSILAYG